MHAPPEGKKIRADKGLNFPDTVLTIGALTAKDRDDMAFIAQHADMIGYSFVQTASDVMELEDDSNAGTNRDVRGRHGLEN